jgi:hypothetical protein
MFSKRGRRYFFWSRHIALWEFIAVAAVFAVPLLFAPFIDVSNNAVGDYTGGYSRYQEYGSNHVSIWSWTWLQIHLFASTYHDDVDALSTFVIAAFTIVLAWSTIRLWRETERLAGDAVEANKFTAKAFFSEQRPWVSVEIEPYSGLKWVDEGPELFAKVILKNTGKTPAKDVYFVADLVGSGSEEERHRDLIRNAADMQGFKNIPGFTLFPEAKAEIVSRFYFDSNDMAQAREMDRSGHFAAGVLLLNIVGSVTYKPSMGGRVGRTDFRIIVSRSAKKERPNVQFAIKLGEDLGPRQIQFSTGFFGNSAR